MSKKEKTPITGSVERNIDFNLKKEDLMLLILEGRKEVMEEEIARLQTAMLDAEKEYQHERNVFNKEVNDMFRKMIEASSQMRLYKSLVKEGTLKIDIYPSHEIEKIPYHYFISEAIRDSEGSKAGSAYIKSRKEEVIQIQILEQASVTIQGEIPEVTLVEKNELFEQKPFSWSDRYNNKYNKMILFAGDMNISVEYQKTLPQYKKLIETIKKFTDLKQQHSDLVTDYDLFSRNQPRAKAAMIKEVLARDTNGKGLLANIMTASKGMRLLS